MSKKLVYITDREHILCQPLAMFRGEIVIHFPNYTAVTEEPVNPGPGEQCFALLVEEENLHVETGSLRLWEGPTIARKAHKEHIRCTVASMITMATIQEMRGEGAAPVSPFPPEGTKIEDLRPVMAHATDQALIDVPYIGEGNIQYVKAWAKGEENQDGDE